MNAEMMHPSIFLWDKHKTSRLLVSIHMWILCPTHIALVKIHSKCSTGIKPSAKNQNFPSALVLVLFQLYSTSEAMKPVGNGRSLSDDHLVEEGVVITAPRGANSIDIPRPSRHVQVSHNKHERGPHSEIPKNILEVSLEVGIPRKRNLLLQAPATPGQEFSYQRAVTSMHGSPTCQVLYTNSVTATVNSIHLEEISLGIKIQ